MTTINGAQHRGDKSQCTRCIQNIEFRWKMCTDLCDTCARKTLKVTLNESHSCKLSHEISKWMTVSNCSYTLTKKGLTWETCFCWTTRQGCPGASCPLVGRFTLQSLDACQKCPLARCWIPNYSEWPLRQRVSGQNMLHTSWWAGWQPHSLCEWGI